MCSVHCENITNRLPKQPKSALVSVSVKFKSGSPYRLRFLKPKTYLVLWGAHELPKLIVLTRKSRFHVEIRKVPRPTKLITKVIS